jgi:hypothetical protein
VKQRLAMIEWAMEHGISQSQDGDSQFARM